MCIEGHSKTLCDELIHNLIIMNDHDVNRRQKQSALEEWKRVSNVSAREGGREELDHL